MADTVEQTKKVIDNLIAFIEKSPWRAYYLEKLNILRAQVDQPCVLAVAGRVKAGKSSFINALLGRDLAMVGVTECTATINYFRKGTPPDPERPVKVVWDDDRVKFETREFLDSLQGNDSETLKKSLGIKHLEYLLPDSLFDEITLVDTPGIDALIENDEHQKATEGFMFKEKSREELLLRDKHSAQTKDCTDKADAVIYVMGQVANQSGQQFLQEFQASSTNGTTAMNAIGVIAKIDLSDAIIEQRGELASSIAQKMQNELNTVIPVSAGLWRAMDELKKNNRLEWMQNKLREVPPEAFKHMLRQESLFLKSSTVLDKLFSQSKVSPLSVDDRKSLKGNMPWRVFVVIATHIYYYPLEEAVVRINDISGVAKVMEVLRTHFFSRGKLLRCYRICNDLRSVLVDIERNRLYDLKNEVRSRKEFEEFIESHPGNRNGRATADKLLNFIGCYIKTEQELNSFSQTIKDKLIPEVETLQLELQQTSENFQALQLIEQNPALFSDEERSELFSLFGMYGDADNKHDLNFRGERQQYWNVEMQLTRSKDRRIVAQYAISAYGKI